MIKVISFFFALPCLTLQAHAAESQRPPNVLLIFTDDQRADTIAAWGNAEIQTPHMDQLVQQGTSFHRAYMQGGMQPATCMPSRAMLLSGQNLFHIDEKLMKHETWPQAFAKAGYRTFMSGKWHNSEASLPRHFQQARSVFAGGMTNPMQAKLRHLKDGKLEKEHPSTKHACAVFADEAIQYLEQQSGDTPFFLYLPFDAPHDPHVVPEDFPVKYDPQRLALPKNFMPEHPWDNGEMKVRDELLLPLPRTKEDILAMQAEYFRYISYLDAQVGRVLNALAKSPHAQNTIIIYASDSGVARGSHGLIGKQNLYEHSMRVPLILAGPGVPQGKSSQGLCYLFDVLPTVGKLCGVTAPTSSEGLEFTALLKNPQSTHRQQLLFAYKDVQRSFSDGRWKLIHYPKVERVQLFDLEQDPAELDNLASKPEFSAQVTALSAQLQALMMASGDAASLALH